MYVHINMYMHAYVHTYTYIFDSDSPQSLKKIQIKGEIIFFYKKNTHTQTYLLKEKCIKKSPYI